MPPGGVTPGAEIRLRGLWWSCLPPVAVTLIPCLCSKNTELPLFIQGVIFHPTGCGSLDLDQVCPFDISSWQVGQHQRMSLLPWVLFMASEGEMKPNIKPELLNNSIN